MTSSKPTELRADASPTKAFFVRMLTRDISLDDCILDLIDNSIDSAWQNAGVRPTAFTPGNLLDNYHVDISFDEDEFRIVDNCGGISLDNAARYAFTFGRRAEKISTIERGEVVPESKTSSESSDPSSVDYSVGVYGIGMKRAIFKIGNNISIRSTHSTGDTTDSFLVPINVSDWLADSTTPWDFDLIEDLPLNNPGVEIVISELNEGARLRFSDPAYKESLIRDVLRRDYMIPLMQGLRITVNGDPVEYQPIELRSSSEFTPMRETIHDGPVTVEIIAGMYSPPPDDNEPDAMHPDKESGWYIVCNGRVVLAADRTSATGWGTTGFPQWHAQYRGFIGIALFSAADPSLLPMTTTKRNVDTSSAVYHRAVNRMLRPVRSWIDYTNARKTSVDEAKKAEKAAKPVAASSVQENSAVGLPKISSTRARVANVNYSVPLKRMNALASALGDKRMSYRDVGIKSFDYAYSDHVDDEE